MRWYLVGSVVVLGVLAGCSGGNFFVEREPWRHDAEVQCLNSGAIKEGAGIVRIKAIRGSGVCGADFPLKVSILGESAALGYSDDPRPPSAIPGGGSPRWPIVKPSDADVRQPAPPHRSRVLPQYQPRPDQSGATDRPISLDPPGTADQTSGPPEPYDFRRPYGAPPSAAAPRDPSAAGAPRDDFSPEPYERRPLVDTWGTPRQSPGGIGRAPLRELSTPRGSASEAMPADVGRRREPPLVPLAPSRDPQATGAVAPVAVTPPATLACPIVSELERWIADRVQPAAMRWFGSPVAEIQQISAYSCRGMNGNSNARISEHAFGNALDIAAFILADGRKITVKGGWRGLPEEQGFLRDIEGAACDQFTTVLAPGSNVYHYDHIHVDLMRRSSGHRICNPHAVSGEEVAARAGARYAGRHEPSITGALAHRRPSPPPKRLRSDPDEQERALPMAEPGNDGEDE